MHGSGSRFEFLPDPKVGTIPALFETGTSDTQIIG